MATVYSSTCMSKYALACEKSNCDISPEPKPQGIDLTMHVEIEHFSAINYEIQVLKSMYGLYGQSCFFTLWGSLMIIDFSDLLIDQ